MSCCYYRHFRRKKSSGYEVISEPVACHLACTTRYLTMKQMKVCVDDEGFTREDPAGASMNVAIEWEDLPGYLDELTARMLGG